MFKWWEYVKHDNVGIKTLKNLPLHFNGGLLEAEDFIKKVLIKNEKFNGHHMYILREYDSNGVEIKL